jgi:hypothetical protein
MIQKALPMGRLSVGRGFQFGRLPSISKVANGKCLSRYGLGNGGAGIKSPQIIARSTISTSIV